MSKKQELKKRAIDYYNSNQVPQTLERLLNKMFLQEPKDVYGYMTEYFSSLSKPAVITKITCEPTVSASGYKTLCSTVYCRINGIEKSICCLDFLKDVRQLEPPPTSLLTDKNAKKGKSSAKKEIVADPLTVTNTEGVPKYSFDIEHVSNVISNTIVPRLVDLQLELVDEVLQECVDELVMRLNESEVDIAENTEANGLETAHADPSVQNEDQPVKIVIQSDSTLVATPEVDVKQITNEINMSSLFISMLVSLSRSVVENTALYRVLSTPEDITKIRLPIPAVSFLSCTQTTSGKLSMFKNVLVLPKPTMGVQEGVEMTMRLFHALEKQLLGKFGPINGGMKDKYGTLIPAFDKPDQLFDMLLQTANNEFQMELHEVCDLILDIGANEIYDQVKKKYEVMIGSLKSVEDLIGLYRSWVELYPIIGFVDPLSNVDEETCALFYKEFATRCYIIDSQHTDDISKLSELIEMQHTDGGIICTEKLCASVSGAKKFKTLQDVDGILMMTDDWNASQTICTIVDLCVSLKAKFLRCSSLSGHGAATLRRYLEIVNGEENNDVSFLDSDQYVFRGKVEVDDEDGGDDIVSNDVISDDKHDAQAITC